eukprot:gene36751-41603_t
MDLRKLKTLIDLVSESNISELEITETEGKVRIVKGGGAAPVQYVQTLAAAPAAAQDMPMATAAAPVCPRDAEPVPATLAAWADRRPLAAATDS